MRLDLRTAGAIALLALLMMPMALLAQDAPVTVAGSGVAAPLFEALAAAAEAEVDVQVTGTSAGLQALCAGDAQVALATRPISVEEEASCNASGVEFVEVLAGHNLVAFVTGPDSELPQCLSLTDLTTVLAPSAQTQLQNWSQVNPAFADVPLAIYGPAVDTATYALTDSIIEGIGLRADLQTPDSLTAAVEEAGALVVTGLADALAAGDAVRILAVDMQTGTGCTAPSAGAVENRTYPAAESLYVYAEASSAQSDALTAVFETLTGEEGAALVEEAGFTPATADAYAATREALANAITGRLFTLNVTDFSVPEQLSGAITIVGSPTLVQYFQDLAAEFTAEYPAVTTETAFVGSTGGLNRLCAGTADITVLDTDISDEANANCADNNVTVTTVDLGSEAVVLLASADADYLSCLTTEQIATTWRADTEDPITSWSQVADSFDDAPMYLFAPAEGTSSAADLLMIETVGSALPTRADITERNNDPLYRAAAVANASSGLTLMTWPEYQTVLNSEQDGVQLVAVDAGEGCVEPGTVTIGDDSYALSRPVQLLVSQSALARPEVQALLWTTLADENYGLLQLADLTGIEFGDLPALRADLQSQFEAASAVAAETALQPEATEVVDEATSAEATAEATETAE